LRQSVLEGLGWNILRIWSTEWWTNASREAERLDVALTALKEKSRAARLIAEQTSVSGAPRSAAPPAEDQDPAPDAMPNPGDAADTKMSAPPGIAVAHPIHQADGIPAEVLAELDPARFHEAEYRPCLAALVEAILRAEAPMRDERLAQHVARAHGFQRTGRRIREATLAVLPGACVMTREGTDVFVWPPGIAPASWVTFRDPPSGCQREPAETAIEELVALARRALAEAASEEETLLLMRDACGLDKLRDAARNRCLKAVEIVRSVPPSA
jgi:hypothetical protein